MHRAATKILHVRLKVFPRDRRYRILLRAIEHRERMHAKAVMRRLSPEQ